MRRFVAVVLLVALFALGGAARLGAGEDLSWLNVDPRLDEALTTFERGDMELAIQQLTAVAEAGNSRAQYFLGRLYSEGFGVANDYCRALEWYNRANINGNANATVGLGIFYQFSHCVSVDPDKAVWYYKRAIDLGSTDVHAVLSILHFFDEWDRHDPRLAYEEATRAWGERRQGSAENAIFAALILGQSYENGSGVDLDLNEAKRYYSFAANQGLAAAQYLLGMLLNNREGYVFDEREALKWIFVAAEQEFDPAVAFRDLAVEEMQASRFAAFKKWASEQLRRIAASDTKLGDVAEWCREQRAGSFDCLRFAIADNKICDPSITENYFKSRYVHSVAYSKCRREVFEAR